MDMFPRTLEQILARAPRFAEPCGRHEALTASAANDPASEAHPAIRSHRPGANDAAETCDGRSARMRHRRTTDCSLRIERDRNAFGGKCDGPRSTAVREGETQCITARGAGAARECAPKRCVPGTGFRSPQQRP